MKSLNSFFKINNRHLNPTIFAFVLANLVVLSVFACCFWLNRNHEELYHFYVKEDGTLEWATFWAFLLASVGCIIGAIRGYYRLKEFQWFYIGLSLFCFIVAMEEISWGQRIFGFQSPKYFLENNFQQEFTAHNMIGKSFRNILFDVIVYGYGVMLPLLMLVPPIRRIIVLLRVIVPPIELIPSFLSIVVINRIYPMVATGEIVELMMGLSFLFAIIFRIRDSTPFKIKRRTIRQFTLVLGVTLLTFGLGFVTSVVNSNTSENVFKLEQACKKELEAIKNDFKWKSKQLGQFPIKEYSNLRLYAAIKNNDFDWMYKGEFSALQEEGLSEDRANYFLDPWNMAFWVAFRVDKENNKNRLVIYSFGPNRKPDSFSGDDISIILLETDIK